MFVNQPYDLQLGPNLIAEMNSNSYTSLSFIVAYAKLSGINRLEPSMKSFKSKGGKIKCVVGIDQKNTTYDALLKLLSLTDELYVFHSEVFTQTFHPKCYWLSSENNLWFAVGSNNLTSGGLFSNYEMSFCSHTTGSEAEEQLSHLDHILESYSDKDSTCVKLMTKELLEELLQNGYVEKEIEQRKRSASEREKRTGKKIFGSESFTAPSSNVKKSKSKPPKSASSKTTATTIQIPKEYLIRQVPKAGGRSKQVHFTIDLLNNYFMLNRGDSIIVQEMHADGSVSEIEKHQVVLSSRNHNVKIEMNGCSILDTNYPTDPNKRPILVVKHISSNMFTYTLLMSGDDGYDAINTRLSSLPKGRSLPSEVIDELTMFDLWPNCPII